MATGPFLHDGEIDSHDPVLREMVVWISPLRLGSPSDRYAEV